MNTKDLFSGNASEYATFRPDYPTSWYEFLYQHINKFDCAWDCATGNGQAAKVLAKKFIQVFATDISEKQMANGFQARNIIYRVCAAEQTSFQNQQFDLITVAQAAHWFQLDKFYSEVKRVLKSDGLIAIWGYGLLSINPSFDIELRKFYKEIVGSYWDPERKLIDTSYQTIPFPFKEIILPEFHFSKTWSVSQLEGYLSTWSAVQKFIAKNGVNPVKDIISINQTLLPESFEVKFPMFGRIGRLK